MKRPIYSTLVLAMILSLAAGCNAGTGPGTKAAATATAVARATVIAGPDLAQVIEVGDPSPFGQQQVAVTVANRGDRTIGFTVQAVFQIGDRTLTSDKVAVKDLRADRRQIVYLTLPEPLPSNYDAARVELGLPE